MIVSLIPRTDFSPVPRVEVRLEEALEYDGGTSSGTGGDELSGGSAGSTGSSLDGGTAATISVTIPEGTERVTLFRRSQGRTLKVRGAVSRPFGTALGILDMEAGFDVESTYSLECWSDTDSLGQVILGTVTLPWEGDPNGVLIQQPLNPNLSVTAKNLAGSWPEIARDAPGELSYPEGTVYPTMVGFGPRRAAEGVALDFGVDSRQAAAQLMATLGTEDAPQLQAWLIRAHHGFLPRVFFCRVGPLTEVDINLRYRGEWSRFMAVVDEIRPPAPALVAATLRYSDLVAATGDTYTSIAAELPRYSQWATAWEYAGAAG